MFKFMRTFLPMMKRLGRPGITVSLLSTKHSTEHNKIQSESQKSLSNGGAKNLLNNSKISPPLYEKFNIKPELLNYSVREFDQTEGMGWRVLFDKKEYQKAAHLIDAFIALQAEKLTPDDLVILNLHAGQMYGFANDYKTAIERIQSSIAQHEKRIAWMQKMGADANFVQFLLKATEGSKLYAEATVAFLKGDQKRFLELKSLLEKCEEVIDYSTGEKQYANRMNYKVLEQLEIGLRDGLSYEKVYPGCNTQENRSDDKKLKLKK